MSGCTCEPGTNVRQPHPPWACEMGPAGWEEDVDLKEQYEAMLEEEDMQRRERLADEMEAAGYDPMGLDGGDR